VKTSSNFASLQTDFVQKLVGRDIRHFQKIIFESQQYFGYLPGTLARIDLALHDAFCQYLSIPVVDFYGER
jgi:L-alanine-DL-glutamate epimerase-like enolase superfamily enzyme